MFFVAEVLEGLQAENMKLRIEHKKFCEIIERAGCNFFVLMIVLMILCVCI